MILDALAALTAEDETAARKVIAADDEVDYDFNAIKHTLAQEIAATPARWMPPWICSWSSNIWSASATTP